MTGASAADAAALQARLKPLVGAHNRAALAGALAGLILGISSIVGAAVVVSGSRGLALALFAFAVIATWRAVAFHRLAIYDTGRARRIAGEVLAALAAGGGALALADLTARFEADDLLAALDLLGRLDLVYASAAEPASGEDDRVSLNPFHALAKDLVAAS